MASPSRPGMAPARRPGLWEGEAGAPVAAPLEHAALAFAHAASSSLFRVAGCSVLGDSASTHPAQGGVLGSINIVTSDQGWVLEKLAGELARRLPYVTASEGPDRDAPIQYYMTYAARRRRLS